MTSTRRNTRVVLEGHGYFVWRKTAKGECAPEKWFDDVVHCHNGKFKNGEVTKFADAHCGDLVGFHKLPMSELATKTLEQLAEQFPAPQ